MTALTAAARQLPDKIEDLAKFVLIGREKLVAVRAEIRAIDKAQLAKDVHQQKLNEAQDIAEAVLDAEVRIGELTAQFEKAKENQYTKARLISNSADEIRQKVKIVQEERPVRYEKVLIDSGVEKQKSKAAQLEELGIKQHTAERFERMARHPEIVERAKERARADGRIVTRRDVLDCIATPSKPKFSYQNIVAEAEKAHEEFKSKDVVSISEAKADASNQEILRRDARVKMNKIYMAVYDAYELGFDRLIAATKDEKTDLLESLTLSRSLLDSMIDAIRKGEV